MSHGLKAVDEVFIDNLYPFVKLKPEHISLIDWLVDGMAIINKGATTPNDLAAAAFGAGFLQGAAVAIGMDYDELVENLGVTVDQFKMSKLMTVEEVMARLKCIVCGEPGPDCFRDFDEGWYHSECEPELAQRREKQDRRHEESAPPLDEGDK